MRTNALLAAIEVSLNRYLALEPSVAAELERLSGRVLGVRSRELGLCLYLAPIGAAVQVLGSLEQDADAVVSGTPVAFAQLLSGDDAQRLAVLADGRIEVSGDARFAQRFLDCLRRVPFDPEEPLSRLVGDGAAHRLGMWLRGALDWGRHAADTLGADVVEYMREETRDLVCREDIGEWVREVDRLSADVDRLAARLER